MSNKSEMKLKFKVLQLAVQRTNERYYEDMEHVARSKESDPDCKLEFPKYPDLAQVEAEFKALMTMIN